MKQTILKITTGALLCLLVASGSAPVRGQDAPAPAPAPASPATAPTTDQSGVNKFYGAVSAVDTKANTFTVDNQTFVVVGETHMTKAADDSAATLADAVVGEPARGTYTKTSDGKLTVTKVRFGKKTGGGGKSGGKKKNAAATTQPQEK